MDLDVIIGATVRETDGLAMSSRNTYLTADERKAAPILYQALCAAKQLFDSTQQQGSIPARTLQETVERVLQSEPLVQEIQYVSVDHKTTMRPYQAEDAVDVKDGAIISIAVQVGSVRLIDNIVL